MVLMLLDWLRLSVAAEWPISCLTVEHIINSEVDIARNGVSSNGAETARWQLSGLYA